MIKEEIRLAAKERMTLCAACPVCDGRGCRGKMPGPGGRGQNESFIRSHQKLRELPIHMRFIHSPICADTGFSLFGRRFRYPIFAAPIGNVPLNFGPGLDDAAYTRLLLEGCEGAGVGAFTGDGPVPGTFEGPILEVKARGGNAIPTVKSWADEEKLLARFRAVEDAGAFAVACDVDCVGLAGKNSPFTTFSADRLARLIALARLPFLVKGIMTASDAELAVEAGAAGIVVSVHGGRALADTPAPVEALPSIARAVKGRAVLFLDGGIRSGADVFRALALGADAVLVGRPFVVSAFGGGAAAVEDYAVHLGTDLARTMELAGVPSLDDIGPGNLML